MMRQWDRYCTLIVTDSSGKGLDLSQLRIKFNIKRSDTQTPNMGDFRIYNLNRETSELIKKEFTKIIFQAGYTENFGVIFEGNIKQSYSGRENQTDTFLDIIAGDGDLAYNFAIINTTLASGSTQKDQIEEAAKAMLNKGVSLGTSGETNQSSLPRGKVLFGMARDVLRQNAESSNQSWSIQNGKIQFVPRTSYLPGEAVVMTAKTGMIGQPTQTNEGINLKCLLNPRLQVGGRVILDNRSIQRLKIDLSRPGSPANIPAPLTDDGVYFILVVEHQGDTRGNEWYSTLTCLNLDVTANPINAVQVGF